MDVEIPSRHFTLRALMLRALSTMCSLVQFYAFFNVTNISEKCVRKQSKINMSLPLMVG